MKLWSFVLKLQWLQLEPPPPPSSKLDWIHKNFHFFFHSENQLKKKICGRESPSVALADLGGRAPPYGSRFFRFDMQNFRNVATSGVHGPPYGKSWIRHCVGPDAKPSSLYFGLDDFETSWKECVIDLKPISNTVHWRI